jgi:glycosyltransferase involved in cell wall biosynthesis
MKTPSLRKMFHDAGPGAHGALPMAGRVPVTAAAEPRLSVVVPAHNARRFISDAIRSALDQLAPDDELIVVDDGSTDGTGDLAETLGPRVEVVRADRNSGSAAARNAGGRRATGDALVFLDADDIALPGRLAMQRAAHHAGYELTFGRPTRSRRLIKELNAATNEPSTPAREETRNRNRRFAERGRRQPIG